VFFTGGEFLFFIIGGFLLDSYTYMHTQTTPSAVWNIQHNLGKKYVNAVAADSSGIRMVGWINDEISTDNLLVIEFSEPLAGTAYIN